MVAERGGAEDAARWTATCGGSAFDSPSVQHQSISPCLGLVSTRSGRPCPGCLVLLLLALSAGEAKTTSSPRCSVRCSCPGKQVLGPRRPINAQETPKNSPPGCLQHSPWRGSRPSWVLGRASATKNPRSSFFSPFSRPTSKCPRRTHCSRGRLCSSGPSVSCSAALSAVDGHVVAVVATGRAVWLSQ